MKYLKVDWKHTFPKEPLELFTELDDADMETRKVHIYPDGHRERADTILPDKDAELSYVPIPHSTRPSRYAPPCRLSRSATILR